MNVRRCSAVLGAALLLGMSAPGLAQDSQPSSRSMAVEAARGVLVRLAGRRAAEFRLTLLSPGTEHDRYEISASGGIVTIKGSSAIALTRGIYDYLRTAAAGMVTWGGRNVNLPKRLPDLSRKSGSSPYEFREYYNVCTFGYTTVWWDWKRWERELDWMAFHGINMPLAMVGQEAVWARVWPSFGIESADLDAFFTGPAFLPWHRMGNVNKHGGPLSDEWMDGQRVLQKKILARMRELGMTPIAPAFSGFIPPAFKRLHPEAKLIENSHWGSFPDGYQTYVLTPDSPLFIEIGRRFIQDYEREYGACQYYLADTFNELAVPVSAEHRYDELASFGKAVYASITSGNPHATWVMQGWMFANDQRFWDRPSVQALLRDVPDDRVLILDLANEIFPGWKKHDGFYGKQWIYSVIHNFGGNNPLYGDLKFFARNSAEALRDSARGRLIGFGLAPEGIENNEVIYELLTDAAWSTSPIDLPSWIPSYIQSRYGRTSPGIERAWALLTSKVYTASSLNFKHAFQCRPSLNPSSNVRDTTGLGEIASLFLRASSEFGDRALFLNDLIEVTAHAVSVRIDAALLEACRAHEAGKAGIRDSFAAEALGLMRRLDTLLSTRSDMRLDEWIAQARSHGRTTTAQQLLEENARTQVTVWGGPELYDYASKLWGGLVRDFYAKRWELFFQLLGKGLTEDQARAAVTRWEEAWTRQTGLTPSSPPSDAIDEARRTLTAVDMAMRLSPSPEIRLDRSVLLHGDSARLSITCTNPNAVVRYTLDGTEPTMGSTFYREPILIGATTICAKSFVSGCGESLPSTARVFSVDSTNGILAGYYETPLTSLADGSLERMTPLRRDTVYAFDLASMKPRPDDFAIAFETILDVRVSGDYTFFAESDDGSRVFVDGTLVTDNDGLHARQKAPGHAALGTGKHRLRVLFFEARGAEFLRIRYSGPGIPKQEIAPTQLFLPERQH